MIFTKIDELPEAKAIKATKTGTTIAGLIFKDGIILGADTRATAGSIVADKNCDKIHRMASNIFCCGAGTAADCERVALSISCQLELHRLQEGVELVPVEMAKTLIKRHLFQHQGHVGCHYILGGVDKFGFHLSSIAAHGSTTAESYMTLGSGSLAAMAALEAGFKKDMTEEEGKKLLRDAIAAGVFNDLGSGSNIDLCVITKDKTERIRPYEVANLRGQRLSNYGYPKGHTQVLSVKRYPITITSEITTRTETEEPMEE